MPANNLPILIILERHWDHIPKMILKQALAVLWAKGYRTLCTEQQSDLTQDACVAEVSSTIDNFRGYLERAKKLLSAKRVDENLCQMSFQQLRSLLRLHVSSGHFNEMALWFRELPGHKQTLETLNTAIGLGMQIKGVDLVRDRLASIRDQGMHLSARVQEIDQLDDARVASFTAGILEAQSAGGVIFTVGQSHYLQLIRDLSAAGALQNIIFIHPYSPKFLDVEDDTHFGMSPADTSVSLLDRAIKYKADPGKFINLLNQEIQLRIEISHSSPDVEFREKSTEEGNRFFPGASLQGSVQIESAPSAHGL